MATRRVLYAGGRTLSLFTIKGKEILDTQVYGHDHAGLAAFTNDIQSSPLHPTWILADLSEEEFHSEKLPHVFGRDQKSMLTRKIDTLFHSTPFRQTLKQGRDESGRRDDRFLISGISDPEMLNPWIDKLLENHIPISGIHSVALLTQPLLKQLKPTHRHLIIISHGNMGGMRQTYFDNGELRVSRLTATRKLDSNSYLELAVSETTKFWRFLTSSHALPNDKTLHVLIMGNHDIADSLEQLNPDNPLIKFHPLSLIKLLDTFKFKGIKNPENTDEFFALLLGSSTTSNPYATHKERRFHYHLMINRGLIAAASITIISTLFALPNYMINGLDSYKEYKRIDKQKKINTQTSITARSANCRQHLKRVQPCNKQ